MANAFKQETCYCGADLSGLTAEVTGYRFGTLPQGRCPNCGRSMLLDAPPIEPALPARPEPPARATRSRREMPESE